MKMRRLLVVACAALALLLACTTGELRGAVDHDSGGDAVCALDSLDALPPSAGPQLSPPMASASVFIDLQFPPSRVTTADVFRPPQG